MSLPSPLFHYVAAILCAAVMMTSGCTHPEIRDPNEGHFLNRKELRITTEKANAGDIASMKLLWHHYRSEINDAKSATPWAIKAAEAGDIESQNIVICHFYHYSGEVDLERARALSKKWGIVSKCAPENSK